MSIDGATRLTGLIGRGIAYSQSPRIHNFALQLAKRNQVYVPFDVPEASHLPALLTNLWALGVVGLNVTQPYKQAVSDILGVRDMPAVNTLSRGEVGWQAHATDGLGLERALQRLGITMRERAHWVFLGDGGVVQAVIWHARRQRMAWRSISILRRQPARDLVWEGLTQSAIPVETMAMDVKHFQEILARHPEAIVIQASSAPLHGDDLAYLRPALAGFRGVFVDLLYGKHPSALLAEAGQRGLVCQDGLPMLIEQARASQDIWWGEAAPYEALLAHLQGA